MGKPYVCTLDEASLKKAREELNEIPSDRMAAIQALRDWVQQQPHLKTHDMQDWEYLMFLRGAKFSQLRARQMIDGNLSLKSELKQWCCDVDSRDPKILQILREGYVVPLPKRTKDGCKIILYNFGSIDPNLKHYSRADAIKAAYIAGVYNIQQELTQVHGIITLLDFSKFTTKHLASHLGNAREMKKHNKLWQDNNPGRLKMFHIYKPGTLFEALMSVMRPFVKKKFLDRVMLHDTLESLYKHVPMELLPEEYLPDDFEGPTIGTTRQIQENFISEITTDEFRNGLLYRSSSKWGVDENRRPNKTDIVHQTFRKLTVD